MIRYSLFLEGWRSDIIFPMFECDDLSSISNTAFTIHVILSALYSLILSISTSKANSY